MSHASPPLPDLNILNAGDLGVPRAADARETRDPSVLLLGGLSSDDSLSMRRYALELRAALGAVGGHSLAIDLERPVPRRYFSAVLGSRRAQRLDRAWCRWVTYPRALRHRRAGLFHILDQGYAQLARSLDVERTIITCHDILPLLARELHLSVPASLRWLFRIQVAYLERARMVIAASAATKRTLECHTDVSPDRIVVVPNGVSPAFGVIPEARARRRAVAGLPDARRIVLQVAARVRHKNTPVLLHAMAELRQRVPGVTLVRIGAPLFADEAALARRLRLQDALTFMGTVSDEVLAEWYNAADVLVFPSSWEGFGWPPLEAMASGTPVVASNIPAVAEVAGDAGILVPPDDPHAFAAAAERVLTDSTYAAVLRHRGLERAAQFTWKRSAERISAVYDALLQ